MNIFCYFFIFYITQSMMVNSTFAQQQATELLQTEMSEMKRRSDYSAVLVERLQSEV